MTESVLTDPNDVSQGKAQSKPRPKPKPLIIGAVIVVAAVLVWRLFFAGLSVPPSIVALSGRIEGDDSAVAAKTTGRLLEIRVREGDDVKAGDIIAILDDEQVQARHEQAASALVAAEAKISAAKAQVAVLREQLNQSQLSEDQSKGDARGRVDQAEADLTAAQADLAQQEASYKLALFDKDAYTRLAATGAVSERQGKLAGSTADQQEAAVTAAKRRVEASQGALTTARANLANPIIREAQVAAVKQQLIQQQAELASSVASAERARYELAEAEANRQDLTVRAPFSGTVITRAAEPGEVVTAGTAIITLLDLTKVYLRGFIPEGQIGKVRLGQPAHVILDSSPHQPLDAIVIRIDP